MLYLNTSLGVCTMDNIQYVVSQVKYTKPYILYPSREHYTTLLFYRTPACLHVYLNLKPFSSVLPMIKITRLRYMVNTLNPTSAFLAQKSTLSHNSCKFPEALHPRLFFIRLSYVASNGEYSKQYTLCHFTEG